MTPEEALHSSQHFRARRGIRRGWRCSCAANPFADHQDIGWEGVGAFEL